MKKFTLWMNTSTAQEKMKMAETAGTSVGHLYQLASGDRQASAALAGNIEAAFKKLYPLYLVPRTELCEACAICPYAKQCLGGKKK